MEKEVSEREWIKCKECPKREQCPNLWRQEYVEYENYYCDLEVGK